MGNCPWVRIPPSPFFASSMTFQKVPERPTIASIWRIQEIFTLSSFQKGSVGPILVLGKMLGNFSKVLGKEKGVRELLLFDFYCWVYFLHVFFSKELSADSDWLLF